MKPWSYILYEGSDINKRFDENLIKEKEDDHLMKIYDDLWDLYYGFEELDNAPTIDNRKTGLPNFIKRTKVNYSWSLMEMIKTILHQFRKR